ncbi:MAG: hypothetical protein VXY17_03485 [Verrucomicrobiota bacterium]|nr:hypothetical protein [Verrucomicrobiota bacterium]
MEDFESFRATRLKMDPSSRLMTDYQWKQSYAANQSARERVGASSGSDGKVNKRQKSKLTNSSDLKSSLRASYQLGAVSDLSNLRQVVRQHSAYSDLRLIVDILAWVSIAVFILIAAVSMFFYTSAAGAIISLLWAGIQIIGVVVARLLVHVLVDIPDIALHKLLQKSASQPVVS